MRLLGLITARGGSKRLPGKNTRLLGKRPLIAWTISAAQESGVLTDILVSTDDHEIARVAEQWGGWVPWLRPSVLANDSSSSIDVVLHALDWYEEEVGSIDGLMLLQPTSPFRRAETIQKALSLFECHNRQPIVSVSPATSHPAWTFQIIKGVLVPYIGWEGLGQRSQELECAYTLNGSIYLLSPTTLRQCRALVTKGSIPLLVNEPNEALDIDTAWDWTLAEHIQAQEETNPRKRGRD